MNLKISGKHVPASIIRLILMSSIKLNSNIEDNLKAVYETQIYLSYTYIEKLTLTYMYYFACVFHNINWYSNYWFFYNRVRVAKSRLGPLFINKPQLKNNEIKECHIYSRLYMLVLFNVQRHCNKLHIMQTLISTCFNYSLFSKIAILGLTNHTGCVNSYKMWDGFCYFISNVSIWGELLFCSHVHCLQGLIKPTLILLTTSNFLKIPRASCLQSQAQVSSGIVSPLYFNLHSL